MEFTYLVFTHMPGESYRDFLVFLMRTDLWWDLYTLYLHTCQVRVTVGDSGLCCCTCVTYFERWLTLLCVDSGM